jgi:hypothetical protein
MDTISRVDSRWFEVETLEYPAPLCSSCGGLLFLRKRVFTDYPRTSLRLAYRCTRCSREIALRSQTRKEVPEGEFY